MPPLYSVETYETREGSVKRGTAQYTPNDMRDEPGNQCCARRCDKVLRYNDLPLVLNLRSAPEADLRRT